MPAEFGEADLEAVAVALDEEDAVLSEAGRVAVAVADLEAVAELVAELVAVAVACALPLEAVEPAAIDATSASESARL